VERQVTTYSWYNANVKYTSTTVHKQNWERAIAGLITYQLRNASFNLTAQRRLYYMYHCSGTTTHTLLPSTTFVNATIWHEVYEPVKLHNSCVHSLYLTCLKIIGEFCQNPLLDVYVKNSEVTWTLFRKRTTKSVPYMVLKKNFYQLSENRLNKKTCRCFFYWF
jgi:hypothetical protein